MEGLPTEGTFGVVDPVTLLCYLWENSFSGAVKVEEGETHRIIYIDRGEVISVATSQPGEKVDDILIAQGLISAEHIRHALEVSPSIADLPAKLLEMGFVTLLDLKQAYEQQIQKIIAYFANQPAGLYSLIDGYKPSRETEIRLPIPKIVSDFFARTENRDFVISLMGNPALPVLFNEARRDLYNSLEMGPDADTMITLMDGHRTMAELSAQSQWKEFDVYRLFALLLVLGVARRLKPGESPDQIEPEPPPAPAPWKREESPAPAVPEVDEPSVPSAMEAEVAGELNEPIVESPEEPSEPQVPEKPEIASPTDALSMDIGEDEEKIVSETPEEKEEKSVELAGDVPKKPVISSSLPVASVKPEPELIARERSSDRKAKRRRIFVVYPIVGIVVVLVMGALAMFYLQNRNHRKSTSPKPAPIQAAPEQGVEPSPSQPPEGEIPPPPEPASNAEAPASTKGAPVTTPAKKSGKRPSSVVKKKVSHPKATGKSSLRKRAQGHLNDAFSLAGSDGTIQLMIACQDDSVMEAEKHDSASHDLWFVPYPYRGRSCFKVFWGHYSSVEEARKTLGNLPTYFKKDCHPKAISLARALAHVAKSH